MVLWKLRWATGQESWVIVLYSPTPQTFMELFQSDTSRISTKQLPNFGHISHL